MQRIGAAGKEPPNSNPNSDPDPVPAPRILPFPFPVATRAAAFFAMICGYEGLEFFGAWYFLWPVEIAI